MILLLGPDATERTELAATLEQLGHDVTVRAAGALTDDTIDRFDAIVVDLAAGQDALRFLRRQSRQPARVPTVCVADRRRPDASSEALRLGAVDIIGRPVHAEAIAAALGNAREFSSLQTDRREVPAPVEAIPEGMFGPSPIMRSVLTLARRVGPSRCAVLIVGERGTGREMIARVIHTSGARNGQPFMKLSCSAVSEGELRRAVAAASASTIYLENLGELPLDLQEKIERHITTTASDGGSESDSPRFIAGAVPRIWTQIDRGEVRRSLIEALSIVKIDLPPLRQRQEDISLMALHFLKVACERNGTPPKTFTRAALTVLAALPWPGNASELQSLCERLAVIVPRGVVLLEDVVGNVNFDTAKTLGRSKETLKAARDRFERDHIAAALQFHRGRMGSAARELGIERTNLYRKIKQLGIRWEGESD
jgi:DNA-binding NtrC family response regulator